MFRLRSLSLAQPTKCLVCLLFSLLYVNYAAAQWVATGPEGGEVRSLACDPQNPDRVFLGTSSGTIFFSKNGGHSWSRYAHLGRGDDYVIDHIAVDLTNHNTIYAAAWTLAGHHTGGLFRSLDDGKNWQAIAAMHGKSIRSMAVIASHPGLIVVGALDGVFQSRDWGQHWQKISISQKAIRNVESIAVDPNDAHVIYAGTWHLAWKTVNGGSIWHRIDNGMIDDSDVFSMIIDHSNPRVLFAGACSGIYKSSSAGNDFERIRDIPFSARRTRVLRQDPSDPSAVYAGTTEGLWVTSDLGRRWRRVTNPDVVVNDVLVDPRGSGRLLLATDRDGILASDDGGLTFHPSNVGFSHRYISSILSDNDNADIIYLGVVNDRENGGVFISNDGGQHWAIRNDGLQGRDVFVLKQAPDGALIAGTNRGLFILARDTTTWKQLGSNDQLAASGASRPAMQGLPEKVNDLEISANKWIAATSAGLFVSSDQGRNWARVTRFHRMNIHLLAAQGQLMALVSDRSLLVSDDGGNTWRRPRGLPQAISCITSLIVTPNKDIILGSDEGAYRIQHLGTGWQRVQHGLPNLSIASFSYDEYPRRLFAAFPTRGAIFESNDGGANWHKGPEIGAPVRRLCIVSGRIVAATTFDGIVVEIGRSTPRSHSGR